MTVDNMEMTSNKKYAITYICILYSSASAYEYTR